MIKSVTAEIVGHDGVKTELEVVRDFDKRTARPFEPVKDIEMTPPTDFEKELTKDSLTPAQLLEREVKELPVDVDERRARITKAKVCALDRMGRHPLDNPTFFSRKDKKELIKYMEAVLDMTDDEITREFNEVCCEVLFAPEAKYFEYPVSHQVLTPRETPLHDA